MNTLQFSVAKPEHSQRVADFFSDLTKGDIISRLNLELKVDAVPWTRFWQFIQNKTLFKSGLDLSEVGTTWLAALIGANAVRPFSSKEIRQFGGESSFSDTAWKRTAESDKQRFSIPWMTDTRVIYYWKDLLKIVGIDGEHAFDSITEMNRTLFTLHAAGIPAWGAPAFACNNTVHQAASWIWATGKDFISRDKKRVLFCDDDVLEGLAAYFNLHRFMPFYFESINALSSAFIEKRVAVVMDGPWLLNKIVDQSATTNIGVSLPPGPPFVGGSNLVIWDFISNDKLAPALELIGQLTSIRQQYRLSKSNGLLPVRNELLQRPPYTNNPHYQTLKKAEAGGRHFPNINLWGPLENSLVQAFGLVWREIRKRQPLDTFPIVKHHLTPLYKRFTNLLELF